MEPTEGNLHHMREDYQRGALDIGGVYPSAMQQFAFWFEAAGKAGIDEPNAMVLATVDVNGKPSSRVVLLKEFDSTGICFFYELQ